MAVPALDLYCLPCAGASASVYLRWRRRLPAWIEVLPLELPGRGMRLGEPLVEDFQTLVEQLCEEIAQGRHGGRQFGRQFGAQSSEQPSAHSNKKGDKPSGQHGGRPHGQYVGSYGSKPGGACAENYRWAILGHSLGGLLAYGITARLQSLHAAIPTPSIPAPSIPAPSIPAASIPAPSIPAPSIPAASIPAPSISAPSIPAPSIPAPSIPATSMPVPSTPAPRPALPMPRRLLVAASPAPSRQDPDAFPDTHDDAALIADLRKQGGTPREVFDSPELLALTLRTLRADYRVCESFEHGGSAPLAAPIQVLAGRDDDIEAHRIEAWRDEAGDSFALHWFDGGHFFIREQEKPVLAMLERSLGRLIQGGGNARAASV